MGTPRGWYDVGGGFAGFWDGEQWTGERIGHEQLSALTRPPAPPPPVTPPAPAAGRVGPPPQRGWVIAGVVGGVILLGMIIGGAVAGNGSSSGRRSTTTTVDTATVFRDTANTLAEVCQSADSSRNGMTIAVPFRDQDCQEVVGLSLALFGFTSADYAKALAGHPVLSEGGGVELTVITASDGEVVTVRKVA